MTEHWKPIDHHPGYEVSDLGNIRNGKPRKVSAQGQVRVDGKLLTVNRLVAAAFLPRPPSPSAVLKPRDGNPANRAASNLVWALRPRRTHWDNDNQCFAYGPWRMFDEP